MTFYLKGSFNGEYEPQGNIEDGDAIAGHAYGLDAAGGPGLSNEALGTFIDELIQTFDIPAIVSRDIAPTMSTEPNAIMAGGATNATGSEGIGTWGEHLAVREFMALNGLKRVISVGQAFHMPRIEAQRKAMLREEGSYQYDSIIPTDLPWVFVPKSKQIWIRNRGLWIIREAIAQPVLRHRGQL